MGAFREHERLLAQIPGIVLWGCLGGLFMAAGYFLLQRLWDPVLEYNYTLSPLFQFQIIGSFAIILLVTGMIAADLFRTESRSRLGPTFMGLLSGICTALVFTIILMFFDLVSHPPIIRYVEDPFLMRMFSDRLLRQWFVPLVQHILISGIVQALGAWYQGSRPYDGNKRDGNSHGSAITGIVNRHRFALFSLLAFLIIPAGLLHLGMNTGIIAEQSSCCSITDSVNVTRTGPDSIRIVMEPDPKKRLNPVPVVKIFLNEKDVSNQSVIAGSGLDDTIDPPDGLLYKNGALVILYGKDASGNKTLPARIRILVTRPDTGTSAEICDRDI